MTNQEANMPAVVKVVLDDIQSLGLEYAKTLSLFHSYANRCPGLGETNLFFRVSDLLIQSGLASCLLVTEGMRNPARRELRFLLEASIKLLFTDQSMPTSPLDVRLIFFDRKVSSSGCIDELNGLTFTLLPEELSEEFVDCIPRFYGHLSSFVHVSHDQISAHIAENDAGLGIGFDTIETLESVAADIFNTYEISLVSCLHAIGQSLAGDLMIAFQDVPWVFSASRFIAALDSTYDYKAERKEILDTLVEQRQKHIEEGWQAHYANLRDAE